MIRLLSEAEHALERLNATIAHQQAVLEQGREELGRLAVQKAGIEEEIGRAVAADPQPGDRWHEMFSFWLYVVAREGDRVTLLSAGAPCTFPQDGELWEGTVAEFAAEWGTVYYLAGRGHDVTGWLSRWQAARTEEAAAQPPPHPPVSRSRPGRKRRETRSA